jgi:hypothetical protein
VLVVWIATRVLTGLALVVVGRRLGWGWRGVLIDGRNRISLSRLQLVLWTVVVLSAVATMGIANAMLGSKAPLDLDIDPNLWALLGISGGSFVLTPMILRDKATRPGGGIDKNHMSQEPGDRPAWIDLFSLEDKGMSDSIDFSKVQQFLITAIVVGTYVVAIGKCLLAAAPSVAGATALTFPPVDKGFIALLGISNAAYLANKSIDHKPLDVPKVPANPPPPGGG